MSDERNDKAFILDQGQWPMWPILPMKNGYDGGFLTRDSVKPGGRVALFAGNIFSSEPAAQLEFGSIEDMLAAGWRVD